MNISQMMHSLIGELRPADVKTLDLKVGQVVRGIVLQLLSDQEAIININGLPIKAKLETPLNQGQTTMLQVQPESQNGQVVLKPLGSSQVQIANESLVDLLRNFGLKDQLPNRQLIQQMHQEGIPLNKENVSLLQSINTKIPEQIPSNQWIQTGMIAFQRGLPLTEQTLTSLHQVLFGKPIHETMSQLQEQARGWLQTHANSSASNPVVTSSSHPLVLQLHNALQQVQFTSSMVQTQAGFTSEPLNANGQSPSVTANLAVNTSALQSTNQSAAQIAAPPTQSSAVSQTANIQNESAKPMDLVGRPPEAARKSEILAPLQSTTTNQRQVANHQSSEHLNSQIRQENLPVDRPIDSNQPLIDAKSLNVNNTMSNEQGSSRLIGEGTWISNVLKALGIGHEQQIVKLMEGPEVMNHKFNLDKSFVTGDLMQDRTAAEIARQSQQPSTLESIKSLLMQIQSSDDLPLAMRENSQQLLQQITGQQLFMAADRTSQFSHMTLFLPLYDENGSQTAAINIQSRKGKRGEIDANNCRLLFDLNMKTLGDTLVDVQVTNKIVSLQVHNDHPLISELLAAGREEISEAFYQLGYHFSSIKCVPFPDKSSEGSAEDSNVSGISLVNSSMYNAKPYKGMDIRV